MSFACTTPTTLSTEPSHTTKRECGADFSAAATSFGESVRSIQDELGARRHDRAHRLVGQAQQALDHVALLGSPARRPARPRPAAPSAPPRSRSGGGARCRPNARSTRPEDPPSSHTTGALTRAITAIGPATLAATCSGRRSASCFGTSSPSTIVKYVSPPRRARATASRPADTDMPRFTSQAWTSRGDACAAEHAGEHGDQGDADLNGRQEALRVSGQRARPRGALDALAFQHRQPGAAWPRPGPARSSRTARSARSTEGR